MPESKSIRNFEYRPCRIATGFYVDFVTVGETLRGLCRNASSTGIRAEFGEPLVIGSLGKLILRHPAGTLKLESQVAYIDRSQAGLVFIFQTAAQQEETNRFMQSITNDADDPQIFRFY